MSEFELEPRAYFQLLHAMLREDGSDAEIERTDKVIEWAQRTRTTIERVCSKTEVAMISVVVGHWTQFRKCPTRETCDMLVLNGSQPKVLQDLLENYDRHASELVQLTHADMDAYLDVRIKDFEKCRLLRILSNAKEILTGAVPNPMSTPKNKLDDLAGTRDALSYIVDRVQKGILIDHVRPDGGFLGDHHDRVRLLMEQAETDRLNGRLTIPTGISIIDEHMGGLRRKELSGVLGFSGQRKTAVVRTMAYNAASAGFHVLHIPIETDFDEELMVYNVMHAHVLAARSNRLSTLSTRRVADDELTDQEDAEMRSAAADFAATVGLNLEVHKPTESAWGEVKTIIESSARARNLDLIIVDYLSMLNDPSARDAVQAMTAIVREAKAIALTANEGKGVAFVTPVQGNRKGWEEAAERDGAWDATGIHMYSELDKSLDNCFYVYTNDEISAIGKIKLGTCKHRRGANIPSTMVPLNIISGMLVGEDENVIGTDVVAAVAVTTDADADVFFSYLRPK